MPFVQTTLQKWFLIVIRIRSNVCFQNKFAIAVSIDTEAAFDSVWWPLIFSTLNILNLHAHFLALVRSYLNNRKIKYKNDTTELDTDIERGYSQGSILGPLFWIILFNPVLNLFSPSVQTIAYADDLIIIEADDSLTDHKFKIENHLRTLQIFMGKNLPNINPHKTKLILHTFTHLYLLNLPEIRQNNIRLNFDSNFTYLGILIEQNLHMHLHLKNLLPKITSIHKKFQKICTNTFGYSPRAKRIMFNSTICSNLHYCSSINNI